MLYRKGQVIMIYTKRLHVDSVELVAVRAIYEDSFPIDERRDFALLMDLLSNNDAFILEAICYDNRVVGMLSTWQLAEWRYIEHFAVEAAMRGGGIGRDVLQRFIDRNELPVVLEVEPPIDTYTRRRIDFYRSMGFVLHEAFHYIQPSYGEGREAVELRLMTYGAPECCSLEALSRLLHKHVYGVE